MLVVLFHLIPRYFSNGFYGVDIFFVITGYLLFRGWQRDNNFAFCSFLKKKIGRIYPPLSVLILLAGVSALPFMYSTLDALPFGKSSLASICGISNYYYIKAYSDYFATDSNINPLLHTWYLSVTIQVYIMWALGCTLLQHAPSRLRIASICLITLASFIYCFSYPIQQLISSRGYEGWGQTSAVSYYDTMGRIWQVMAGGIVCILPTFRQRIIHIILLLTGLLMLCYPAFCNHELPIWSSLLIVTGTILILRYAENSRCHVLLENKPLLIIGKISFSLYLIHFPIFVFFRRWERLEPDMFQGILLLAISLAGASIMWNTLERHKPGLSKGGILVILALMVIFFTRGAHKLGLHWDRHSIPYPAYPLSEEHTHYPASVYNGYDKALMKGNRGTQDLLRDPHTRETASLLSLSGINTAPQFVLVGNSVAQQLYAGFHEICKERRIPGIHLTSIIFPLWNQHVWINDSYYWTEQKAKAFIAWLRCQPDIHTVVVSYLWKSQEHSKPVKCRTWDGKTIYKNYEVDLSAAKEFCLQIKKAGKHVVIITPTPVFSEFENNAQLGKGEDYIQWKKMRGEDVCLNGDDAFVITKEEYMNFNAEIFELLSQLEREGYCQLLHIEQGIFQNGHFHGLHNRLLFCRDKTHITPAASIKIMQNVADEFESIIRRNQSTPVKCHNNK